jgi:hypothetical protein
VVTNPEATFDLTQLDIRETQLRIAQLESAGFVTRPELVENGRLLHCCVVAPIEHFLEMYIHWLVRDDREENVNPFAVEFYVADSASRLQRSR